MARFEAHITADKQYAKEVEAVAEEHGGWVFSVIAGCPLLGKGTYCYLTGFDTEDSRLMYDMIKVAAALAQKNVPVLRTKIERIVFDSRTGMNELMKC